MGDDKAFKIRGTDTVYRKWRNRSKREKMKSMKTETIGLKYRK